MKSEFQKSQKAIDIASGGKIPLLFAAAGVIAVCMYLALSAIG